MKILKNTKNKSRGQITPNEEIQETVELLNTADATAVRDWVTSVRSAGDGQIFLNYLNLLPRQNGKQKKLLAPDLYFFEKTEKRVLKSKKKRARKKLSNFVCGLVILVSDFTQQHVYQQQQ